MDISETAPSAATWNGWSSLGGILTSDVAGALNADGRLEVFVQGGDFALWHMSETAPSAVTWNAWNSLGGDLTSDVTVAPNADRQLEVFAGGIDNALWHNSQLAAGGPARSGWSSLGEAVQWKLVWNDEFNGANGSAPDAAKWTFDVGGKGWGNSELEYYTSRLANAYLQDGNLVIQALKEHYTGSDGVTRDYTSARLKTQGLFQQAYGRF